MISLLNIVLLWGRGSGDKRRGRIGYKDREEEKNEWKKYAALDICLNEGGKEKEKEEWKTEKNKKNEEI